MRAGPQDQAWPAALIAVCAAMGVLGCGLGEGDEGSPEQSEEVRSDRHALGGGEPAGDPAQGGGGGTELMAVASLFPGMAAGPGWGFCTGTLIAPQVVLTSAHCFRSFATGQTQFRPGDFDAIFADGSGDSREPGADTIPVAAVAVHPKAYASTGALDVRHDLALAYLEHAPTNPSIQPLPVVVGNTGWSDTSQGRHIFDVDGWVSGLSSSPVGTLVAYGGGSTDWCQEPPQCLCPQPANYCPGRDYSTKPFGYDPNVPGGWQTRGDPPTHPTAYQGDSGSPLLVGSGDHADWMVAPTALPASAGLPPGRYVIGVMSQNASWPTDAGIASTEFYTKTHDLGNGDWISTHVDDLDGDGFPNHLDNCPGIENDQANCNLHAEIDRGADELGDACDPAPCPFARMPARHVVEISTSTICGTTETGTAIRDRVKPEPLGSRHPITGFEEEQTGVATQFRFCQIDQQNGHFCGQDQRDDDSFGQPDAATNPLKRVSLVGIPYGTSKSYTYPSERGPRTWHYEADFAYWQSLGILGSSVQEVEGTFALRAGNQASSDLLGTEFHPQNGVHATSGPEPQGTGLARHYIDLDLVSEPYDFSAFWCVDDDVFQKLVPIRFCPMCERPGIWIDTGRPVDAILAKGLGGGWGIVDRQGRGLPVDGLVRQALLDALSNDTMRFVPSAEPSAEMGTARAGVQALIVDASLTPQYGVHSSVEGFDMRPLRTDVIEDSLGIELLAVTSGGPSAREDHVSIFSRALNAFLVVGGNDAATGEPARDIWIHGLVARTWSQLATPGYKPEHVLAATVSFRDRALWVLDERRVGWLRMGRLVRISVGEGKVEQVWSGPRLGLFEKHWLAVAPGGDVLLFASSERFRKHATVRLSAPPFQNDPVQVGAIAIRRGPLVGQPLVDMIGVQYVAERRNGRTRSYRIDGEKGVVGSGHANLGGCL